MGEGQCLVVEEERNGKERKGRLTKLNESPKFGYAPYESVEKDTLSKILPLLQELTESELKHLNRVVVEHLRQQQKNKDLQLISKFRIDDRVCFDHSSKGVIEGYIVSLNQKSVSVATVDEHRWRISPELLSKVIE